MRRELNSITNLQSEDCKNLQEKSPQRRKRLPQSVIDTPSAQRSNLRNNVKTSPGRMSFSVKFNMTPQVNKFSSLSVKKSKVDESAIFTQQIQQPSEKSPDRRNDMFSLVG